MATNQTPSPYNQIKAQISFAVTGAQDIICPNCGQAAKATTSGLRKVNGRKARNVKTSCRHCGTIYTFIWS